MTEGPWPSTYEGKILRIAAEFLLRPYRLLDLGHRFRARRFSGVHVAEAATAAIRIGVTAIAIKPIPPNPGLVAVIVLREAE